jgi:Matrixin
MRLIATLLILAAFVLAPLAPARAYTLQYTDARAVTQIHWPTTNIVIALSDSLNNPPSFVHATGAQVVLAARRALSRWALASNIQFTVTTSSRTTAVQDGVSLITIAPENSSQFNSPLQPGRAFVFFDQNGLITEADLAINPNVTTQAGAPSFFSTDGTPGSYDLESTFTHEIGHMLGLEHSGILAATMQPRQGVNGTFDLPNFTTRTLAADDIAGIRAIYGPHSGLGSITGRVTTGGNGLFGAHVFAEDAATGRVVAGNITLSNGSYRIDSLPPGQYRVVAEPLDEPVNVTEIPSSGGAYAGLRGGTTPFVTTEGGTATVSADAATTFNDIAVQGGTAPFNPKFIGTGSSGQLSTVAVPFVPGQTMNVLVGGDNLGVVTQISVTSPFITISGTPQFIPPEAGFGIPVWSFDITPSILTPPGEYDVRLQSASGQLAYVTGGLTVDLPNGVAATGPNLIDDTQFFVAQHYRDFLSREPDASGLQFWTNNIESCGADQNCRAVKRIDTSAAFFLSIEFQDTGYFVYRVYKAAFGNLPGKPVPVTFQQFFPDTQGIGRGVVVGVGNWQQQLDANKSAYALAFVQRPDFQAAHGGQDATTYVNSLFANAGVTPTDAERQAAISAFNNAGGGNAGRAAALRSVAESGSVTNALRNEAFVLMQYYGYLRRNPDDPPDADFTGYNFWLGKLNQFGGNYVAAEMVKAFLSATEYRSRFGPA